MYPELLKLGPFTIYSYGLMLGLAFIVASYLLTHELRLHGMNPNIATEVTLIALVAGLVGAKLFHLLENWDDFMHAPWQMAISPAGLTWYGGFLLAVGIIYFYLKRKKIRFLQICDFTAPGLALGYGIARIGCQLAGDGDYGIPSDLPWAMAYPHGTVPTTARVHPAPVYETLASVVIFLILWKLRKRGYPVGKLFMIYLLLSGIERLLVEFIRINPHLLFGLSQAQLISVALIAVGAFGVVYYNKQSPTANVRRQT
jgi:phosphatidylglycerol:prolipoprotein diacylglycerol transferase